MARQIASFELSKRDLKRLEKMMSTTRLRRLLRKEVNQATILNGRAIKRAIKSNLRNSRHIRNASLTIAIKGSSAPLRDTGLLLRSISVTKRRWDSTRIGVIDRGSLSSAGLTMERLATILQKGAVIPVTPGMRGLFHILWLSSIGRNPHELNGRAAELFNRFQNWKPISRSTSQIIIPARPFVKPALDDHKLKLEIRRNYRRAIQQAWKIRNF